MIIIALVSIVATRLQTVERGPKVQVLFKSTFDGRYSGPHKCWVATAANNF